MPQAFQAARTSSMASVPARAVFSSGRQETLSHQVGLASWYGGGEPLNRHVAMGHRFDPESLEAAMWDVPLGTVVRVCRADRNETRRSINRDAGPRCVVVRVTDRGPARRFRNRVIDLTRQAFTELAPLRRGLLLVVVERLS